VPDDDREAIRREKIEFKNQQERFVSVVLNSLTDPGSEVEDHFLDRLSNFLRLFPHVGQKVDEILLRTTGTGTSSEVCSSLRFLSV
jgi:hypothetical protein